MIIKEVNLETVCGYTSKLPDNQNRKLRLQENQMSENHL